MKITIRYFDGCPHWLMAEGKLKEAIASKGLDAQIDYELVSTPEEAERLLDGSTATKGSTGPSSGALGFCPPVARKPSSRSSRLIAR